MKELRAALGDRVNLIAAKAAGIAEEWQARPLLPELLKAYDRFFLKGGETDPQCWGKNAVSKALKSLGFAESAVFLRGLHHRQPESTWGGKADSAGPLRATCALALVQCLDIPREETLLHLLDALTDEDAGVRTEAVRALEQMNGRDVALLLRLKARLGDEDLRVTGQVLECVFQLEGAGAVPFVAGFLGHANEEVSEEAALALGASRLPEAINALKQAWLAVQGRRDGAVLLRALSASRQDAALDFLLEQMKTGRLLNAEEALRAMDLHKESEQIVARIKEAVAVRPELSPLFEKTFR
jgi:HEAT repeat protein